MDRECATGPRLLDRAPPRDVSSLSARRGGSRRRDVQLDSRQLGRRPVLDARDRLQPPHAGWPLAVGVRAKARVDLLICEGVRSELDGGRGNVSARVVIEVKRASSPRSQVDDDLRCLALLKRGSPGMRAFLVVASEARSPQRFVRNATIDPRRVGNSGRTEVSLSRAPDVQSLRELLQARGSTLCLHARGLL